MVMINSSSMLNWLTFVNNQKDWISTGVSPEKPLNIKHIQTIRF